MSQDWIQYEKKMLPLMYMPPSKQVLLSLNIYVALGFFSSLATSSQTEALEENLSK